VQVRAVQAEHVRHGRLHGAPQRQARAAL
jgi:hypothetical protein